MSFPRALENDKNSGWENVFSHRLFFHFPRMLCIRPAAERRQPVARSAGIQLAKSQYSFCKGVSAWRLCRIQLTKLQSFMCENLCA